MSSAPRGRTPPKGANGGRQFDLSYGPSLAQATMVNRTHRVVRERADALRDRRSKLRSLLAPMSISGAFLLILISAVWSLLDQYDIAPSGIPDASSQFLVVVLWFAPVFAAVLALTLLRRSRADRESYR